MLCSLKHLRDIDRCSRVAGLPNKDAGVFVPGVTEGFAIEDPKNPPPPNFKPPAVAPLSTGFVGVLAPAPKNPPPPRVVPAGLAPNIPPPPRVVPEGVVFPGAAVATCPKPVVAGAVLLPKPKPVVGAVPDGLVVDVPNSEGAVVVLVVPDVLEPAAPVEGAPNKPPPPEDDVPVPPPNAEETVPVDAPNKPVLPLCDAPPNGFVVVVEFWAGWPNSPNPGEVVGFVPVGLVLGLFWFVAVLSHIKPDMIAVFKVTLLGKGHQPRFS